MNRRIFQVCEVRIQNSVMGVKEIFISTCDEFSFLLSYKYTYILAHIIVVL